MIIYVDMDDVLCNYQKAHKAALEKNSLTKYPQSQKGFFENLEPNAGALEAVTFLREHFDVYILTAPSTRNPLSYTEKRLWVEKYFAYEFTKKLILCSNKGLLKGDLLIDDHVSGKGQEAFEGRLIHFGSEDFPDWKTVSEWVKGQLL